MDIPVFPSRDCGLGRQLEAARRARGISKARLAISAHINVDTVTEFERSGRGQLQSLSAIVGFLECRLWGQPQDESVGEWLLALRSARHLGQRAAAARAGLTQPTIIALERSQGRTSSLRKLLAAYQIPLRLAYEVAPSREPLRSIENVGQRFELYEGDCRDRLRSFAAEGRRFSSCVTDPPYEIGAADWDQEGIASDPALWKLVSEVLLPGAYVLAFAAPRKAHRLAGALEDAGFLVRDSIAWLFSSGVPWGSKDVSAAIDTHLGAERPIIGQQQRGGRRRAQASAIPLAPECFGVESFSGIRRSAAVTEEAKAWVGFRTRLKPGREDVIVAMKPFSEPTIEENVLRWGVGALNVDAVRISGRPRARKEPRKEIEKQGAIVAPAYWLPNDLGRYPSNVFLGDGFEDDRWARHFHVAKPTGKERYGHPTAKPVPLLRTLLRLCTPPGGWTLDPFAGSASTGEAAIRESFGFVGVEINPDYAEAARTRLCYVSGQHR